MCAVRFAHNKDLVSVIRHHESYKFRDALDHMVDFYKVPMKTLLIMVHRHINQPR